MSILVDQILSLSVENILVIYVGVASVVIISLIFIVGTFFSRLGKQELHKMVLEEDAYKEADQILSKAGKVSLGMVKKASEYEVENKETIDRVSKEQIHALESQLKDSVKEVATSLKKELTESVVDMGESLKKETIEAQKAVDLKISEEYKALQKELAEYYAQRVSKIDKEISSIVAGVSSKVMGRAMSLKDHQEYVLKVLEEERKRGRLSA
jgi:hypothetical protein